MIRDTVKIPLIAAGGIADGRGMMAAFALGAEAVQIGSRFVATPESSAHEYFKKRVITSSEGDTVLTLKQITPVRLLKNKFFKLVQEAEEKNASIDELKTILGRGRAKKGMFEGDLEEGELEIGQVAASIRLIKPAGAIVQEIWTDFLQIKEQLRNTNYD